MSKRLTHENAIKLYRHCFKKAKAQGRAEVLAEIREAVNNEISKDHINFNHADIKSILDKVDGEK